MFSNQLVLIENFKNILKILPIKKIQIFSFEVSFLVSNGYLPAIILFFKNHLQSQYKILTCISCVDYPLKKFSILIEQ